MDSPRTTDRTEVLDVDTEGDRGGRDLRDVLRHLVVADGNREDVSLSAVARAAKGSERLLPELLDALEAEATPVRVGAAWALCALADDQPEAVEYVAARITERMDDEASFEVSQVLAYLRGRYPGRVADVVDVAVEVDALGSGTESGQTAGRRDAASGVQEPRPESPARAQSGPDEGKRIETDGGVPAGTVADLGDGRQVVRPGDRGSENRPARPSVPAERGDGQSTPPRRPAGPRSPPRDHPTHPDFESADDSADEATVSSDAGAGQAGDATPAEPTRSPTTTPEDREAPDTFAAIGSLSSLDRLSAVDTGVEERYATGYRCRAVSEDEERGVEVRLFDRPDEGDRLVFRADLEDCLARWQALAESDSVVDVAEWGERPRPWARTQPVDTSLAARGRPPVDEAVDQAVDLARAVGELHSRGAVHGGLDPKNVVYPCDPLDALERPMLDNVGLMGVFRSYFEPAKYLDPRFAAPEYFDDDFGSVDAATDVYGLGSLVYYLLTGRPPFVGSYSEIREGVLGEQPTPPGTVADAMIPATLDTVVSKALTKQKIKRYDGVQPFLRDLERVRDSGR